jgi:hypothetical protein
MLFSLIVVHNEWSVLTLEEWITDVESYGLQVVDQDHRIDDNETVIELQGTKEAFFSWAEDEGGPSFNEEELEEELIPV